VGIQLSHTKHFGARSSQPFNKDDVRLFQSQVLNLNAVRRTHLTERCCRRITLVFRIREMPRKPDVVAGFRGFPPFLHTSSGKVTKIILRRLP